MTKVKIVNTPPGQILEIVREMREENLDFTFSYHPSKWEGFLQVPNYTIFSFVKEKEATYFILKWKMRYD